MKERFVEDINKRLLWSKVMEDDEKLIIFNSLVTKYKKLINTINEKEENEGIEKVIKSLPKYNKYFKNYDFDKSIKDYIKDLPEGVELDQDDILSSIKSLSEKTIFIQAEIGKFSRNSGINILNDRTNYTNNIADFELASQKFTPEFISETVAKMGEVDSKIIESYKTKCEYLCKTLAESAIKDKIDYYTRTIDYLVDFYADNEIAKREEASLA